LTILIFQQSLYSQKEIVGKVEFYKSIESDYKRLESMPDQTIKNLSNKIHKLEIEQNNQITQLKTDSTGIFKIRTELTDSIKITFNDYSPAFTEKFEFDLSQVKDTLKLKISDKKLCIYIDSISAPKFYEKYNEKQAELDFKNGRKKLLGIGIDWRTEESIERSKEIESEYEIKYEYIWQASHEKIRIMYRYNQIMKKLIGINKNVW
jgi:hypothetical protein